MVHEKFEEIGRIINYKSTGNGLLTIGNIKIFINCIYGDEIMKNKPKRNQSFVSQLMLFEYE